MGFSQDVVSFVVRAAVVRTRTQVSPSVVYLFIYILYIYRRCKVKSKNVCLRFSGIMTDWVRLGLVGFVRGCSVAGQ